MGYKWVRPVVVTPTVEGGYILVRSHALLALWSVYRKGHLSLADVRTALAAVEVMHAMKTGSERSRWPGSRMTEVSPAVDAEFVRRLTGSGCIRKARARLKRLADAGLSPEQLVSRPGQPMAILVSVGDDIADRPVPVPRRLLRWLARDGTAAFIALAIGHLLRGAYLRAGVVRLGGTCSAAWIAQTFAIDERTAKAGRYGLVERGWLVPVASPCWHRQRHGATFTINRAWTADSPVGPACTQMPTSVPVSPPRTPCCVPNRPPPKTNKNLPLRGIKNQDRDSGVCAREEKRRVEGVPTFNDVRVADLDAPERTMGLFADAMRRGWIGDTEAERLRFFTTVQHARRAGTRPTALLATLARRRCWMFGTNEDEDRARVILRRLADEPSAPAQTRDVLSMPTARRHLGLDAERHVPHSAQPLKLSPDRQGGEDIARLIEASLRKSLAFQTQAIGGPVTRWLGSGPPGTIQIGTQRHQPARAESVDEECSGPSDTGVVRVSVAPPS